MTGEFPEELNDSSENETRVTLLAENAVQSAQGQASDAEYTGDLADTPGSRIESEAELEADDKI